MENETRIVRLEASIDNIDRFSLLFDKIDIKKIPLLYHDESYRSEYIKRVAQNADLLFACKNGADIGVCATYTNRPPLSHITFVGVVPEHSGKGIGRMLLMDTIELAKERGLAYITIETDAENVFAQRLYGSCGFAVENIKGQAIWMRLDLPHGRDGEMPI